MSVRARAPTSHSMQAIVNSEPPGQGGEARLVQGEKRRINNLLLMRCGQRPPSADTNCSKVCWNSSRSTSGSVTSLSLGLSLPIPRCLSLIPGIAGTGARLGGSMALRESSLTVVVSQNINVARWDSTHLHLPCPVKVSFSRVVFVSQKLLSS